MAPASGRRTQSASAKHATHRPAASSQRKGLQSPSPRQVTQVPEGLQYGMPCGQSAPLVQPERQAKVSGSQMGVVPSQSEFPTHTTHRPVRERQRGSAAGQSASAAHSTHVRDTGSQTPLGEGGAEGGWQSVESRQPTQAPAPLQIVAPGSLAHELGAVHGGWQAWSPGQQAFPPVQSADVAHATQAPRTHRGRATGPDCGQSASVSQSTHPSFASQILGGQWLVPFAPQSALEGTAWVGVGEQAMATIRATIRPIASWPWRRIARRL